MKLDAYFVKFNITIVKLYNSSYWPSIGVWFNTDFLTVWPLTKSWDPKSIFDQSDKSSQNDAPDNVFSVR